MERQGVETIMSGEKLREDFLSCFSSCLGVFVVEYKQGSDYAE
jgi:hypothetical protein